VPTDWHRSFTPRVTTVSGTYAKRLPWCEMGAVHPATTHGSWYAMNQAEDFCWRAVNSMRLMASR
jgi:hypothetical protein